MGILISNWIFDVLICITIGAIGIIVYLTRNQNYWKKLGVRQLHPSFFFGNIGACVMARQTVQELLTEVYEKGKGTGMIGFYAFDKPYLMIRDPELIKEVLIRNFQNFSNKILGSDKNDPLGTANLFLVKNPPWKQLRQKLTAIFTSGKLKNMYELMMDICQDFDNYLDGMEIDDKIGKPVAISESCAKFATDLIGTTGFGMKFNSLTDPNAEFRKYGREIFRSTYKRYLQLLAIFFVPSLRPYMRPKFFDEQGSNFLRHVFWHVINDRIESGVKRHDVIDTLIEIKKTQETDAFDTFKLEGDALVAQAAVLFTGGFETSSTTMSFILYELSRNLEIQTRLRNEILEGLKKYDGKLTYDMVTTLPYLNMVVHEGLRMYPILSWIDRVPETNFSFPGSDVIIEKGTPLILPMRALHMDPNYFPNPEKFDPERFSEENKKNIKSCSYFPFGEGPRNCIGGRLGLIQTKLGVIKFLTRYELTPCKDTPIPMNFDRLNVLTHPPGELYLNLRKISK